MLENDRKMTEQAKQKKYFRTLSVSSETLEFLEKMKESKGFTSYDELVYNCAKTCEYWTRGQILRLSEIDTSKIRTAKSENEMYFRLKGLEVKKPE